MELDFKAQAQDDPGAVSNLRLSSPNPGELVIAWDAPGETPTDYRVAWTPSGEDFLSYKAGNTATKGNAYPSSTAHTVSGLAEGAEYEARVRARFSDGEHANSPWSGPWSSVATITISEPASPTPEPTPVPTAEPTPEPTPQPTPEADNGEVVGLTLTSDTAGSLAIAWNAPSPEPDSYRVVWAEESLDFLAYRNNNEANRGNEYPSGNATSITLDGLTKSDTFKVRARARYASGGQNGGSWSGPWIDVVTARVKDDPPPAPTGLIAGAVSHDTVTLTWDDPQDSRITGYRVQRGPNAGSLSVIAEDTGSSAASYTDDTVSAETTYHYAVQAITQDGAGPPAAVIVTTLGDPEQPDSAEQGDRTERQTPDTTAPMVASAAANGASLVITFDEDLAAASALANSRRPPPAAVRRRR